MRGFFSCFNGKSPFDKTMVMTIPKIIFLIGCYLCCLLLDLKYKNFKSVFWPMQNEEIVNTGEWFYNTNGLNIKVQ